MENALSQPLRDRKLYGLIFLLGGLFNLLFAWNTLKSFPLQDLFSGLLRDPLNVFLGLLLQPIMIGLYFLVAGMFVLSATRPTTVWALRRSTIIGLVVGCGLGMLFGMGIANQGHSGLGVDLVLSLPLPILLFFFGMSWQIVLPHLLAMLLVGGYAFRLARRSGSVKYAFWHTVCLVFLITLFTQVVGISVGWIGGHMLGQVDGFDLYAHWVQMLGMELFTLLLYTLLIGLPAAALGRGPRQTLPAVA